MTTDLNPGPSWWRRNRLWLVALPLSLVLMLGASSYRVRTLWWDSGLHHRVADAGQGTFVNVHDPGIDLVGAFDREFRVRLVEVRRSEDVPQRLLDDLGGLPEGLAVYEVTLDFEAEPDQQLAGCSVHLIGDDGVEYGRGLHDPLGQVYACVPETTPGPSARFSVDPVAPSAPARPQSWTVHPLVLAADDVEIAEVRVYNDPPEYVSLRPRR